MKTIRATTWIFATLLAAVLGVAPAVAAGPTSSDPDSDSESLSETTPEDGPDLSEIRARAETMPVDARLDMDRRVSATLKRIDDYSADKKQTSLAKRMAAEFSTTSDALLEAKSDYGFTWGDLVIANTLLANSGERVSLSDLATLRSEGLSWGSIAFGLQFRMEDFEDAIRTEGKVAMGLSKPDGKAAPIGE